MADLTKHLQRQQDAANHLEGVLEALGILHNDGAGPNAQAALIRVASSMAADLSTNLDSTRLPDRTP